MDSQNPFFLLFTPLDDFRALPKIPLFSEFSSSLRCVGQESTVLWLLLPPW